MKEMLQKINKIKKQEKGAISTVVVFTIFMFVAILTGAYLTVTTLQKTQKKSDLKIQSIYEEKVNNVAEVYNEIVAKYDEPYMPKGFEYVEGTWNSGYTIKETSTGNVFVWVPCVLDASLVKDGDKVEIFKKVTTGKYNEDLYALSTTDTNITDAEPTNSIKASVGKYGGFYIAAYETGVPLAEDGITEIETTAALPSQKARSVSGATVWTNITRTNAIIAAQNMIKNETTGVNSALISAEAWDTTLQWMVNSSKNAANEPNVGYDIDSTGNGWYEQSSKNSTGQYKINNIYDMAGNVWEWTTENGKKGENNLMINRGGNYYDRTGLDRPAAYRNGLFDNAYDDIGFRVVLYK